MYDYDFTSEDNITPIISEDISYQKHPRNVARITSKTVSNLSRLGRTFIFLNLLITIETYDEVFLSQPGAIAVAIINTFHIIAKKLMIRNLLKDMPSHLPMSFSYLLYTFPNEQYNPWRRPLAISTQKFLFKRIAHLLVRFVFLSN